MATDLLFSGMAIPIVIVLIGLIGSTLVAVVKHQFPSIGWEFSAKRVLFGYTGAALALLVVSYIEATQMGYQKVVLGHIETSELGGWILFWGFYVFVMWSTFAFFVLTVLGLPLIAALSRVRLASVLGVAALCCALAGVVALIAARFPVNNWCEANLLHCVWDTTTKFLIVAIAVGLGFAAFARMPLVCNRKQEEI